MFLSHHELRNEVPLSAWVPTQDREEVEITLPIVRIKALWRWCPQRSYLVGPFRRWRSSFE